MVARYRLGWYLAGATLARMGDELSGPALLLFVVAVSGSGRRASVIYGGLTIAAGVGGPLFGIALDRSGRPGRLLATTIFAYGAGLGAVAVLAERAAAPVGFAVAAVVGLLAPALAGGWTSQLAAVVPAERLPRGHALDAATYNVASLAGPALAAGIAATLGAGWAIAGAVGLLLAAVPLAAALPPREHAPEPAGRAVTAVASELAAGFRAIVMVPGLRRITAASCVAFFGYGVFIVSCPVLGRDRLGAGSDGVLLLCVAAAAGLLTTGLMARWPPSWRPEITFLAATAVAALAYLLPALAAGRVALLGGAAVLGMADGPQLASIFAIRQRDAPRRLRGQIFTTAASVKLTSGAIGALAGGALLGAGADRALLAAAGAQATAVVVWVLTRPAQSWPRRKSVAAGH
jgi:MFS family permease